VFDPQSLGERCRRSKGRGSVPGHPLIHAQCDQSHCGAFRKLFARKRERDGRVLPTRQRDGHRPSRKTGQLSAEFLADPFLDGGTKMTGARVSAAVRLVDDRVRVAGRAPHGFGTSRRYLSTERNQWFRSAHTVIN
jgi:hypothetical protein